MRHSGHLQRHTDGRPARWGVSVVVTLLALLLLGHHDGLLFDVGVPAHAASAHVGHETAEAAGPAERHGHGAHTTSPDTTSSGGEAADSAPASHTDPAHGAAGHTDCSTSGAVCWSAKSELALPTPALVPEIVAPQPAVPVATLAPTAGAWAPSPPDLAQLSILRI